jgi:hypothetical protein
VHRHAANSPIEILSWRAAQMRRPARHAGGYGCRTLEEAWSLGWREEDMLHVSFRPLHTLLAQSDWVVPQLPGHPSTQQFIDRERLALMKPGACLTSPTAGRLGGEPRLRLPLATQKGPLGEQNNRRPGRRHDSRPKYFCHL